MLQLLYVKGLLSDRFRRRGKNDETKLALKKNIRRAGEIRVHRRLKFR